MAGTPSSRTSTKRAAALNQVRVTLREIDALLDFPDAFAPVQLIGGRLRVPSRMIPTNRPAIGPVQGDAERRREEQAERIAATPAPPPPGVYGKVAGRLGDRWWRTFDRQKSTPIPAGKWVYVFQATSEHGDGARLEAGREELFLKAGRGCRRRSPATRSCT